MKIQFHGTSNMPPTATNGFEMLHELENRIPKKEAEIRKNEFENARNFILLAIVLIGFIFYLVG